MTAHDIPPWVTYPEDDWVEIGPKRAGLEPEKLDQFMRGLEVRGASFGGEDHSGNAWGAVITRGGHLVHSWGDRHYRFQTASTGKAFILAILGFAVEDGRVDPDELVRLTWTGEGQLSHPHKHLDRGFHERLTWNHLAGPKEGDVHYGGFPIELGARWKERRSGLEERDAVSGVPEWADWTGDPYYDTYSHVEPGTAGFYSSAGFWRLGQALTALWDRDLKDVLDERLFGKIGIPADRWDWPAGRVIKDSKYLYPTVPDS